MTRAARAIARLLSTTTTTALIIAIAAPAAARADAALLFGFTTGAAVETAPMRARFLLGAGPDLLTTGGLTLSARGEVTHTLDGATALLAGWSGPGLRTDEGLPLGLALGPALTWTADADWALGGRARASWGLWYARAVLELDVTVALPLARDDNPIVIASLALRWVPWSPWRL